MTKYFSGILLTNFGLPCLNESNPSKRSLLANFLPLNCHLKHGHPVIDPTNGKVTGYNFRMGINPNVRQDCVNHKTILQFN